MGLRWVVGGSYQVQAAPEPSEPTPTLEDVHPNVVNFEALKDGSEVDPVFEVPPHDPETHQGPAEIRLYAVPVGDLLPLPGADGSGIIASPYTYTSAAIGPAPEGVPEIRIDAPVIEDGQYMVLMVYGFAK